MVNEIQQYRKTNTSPGTSLSDTLGNMFLWGKKNNICAKQMCSECLPG